MRHIFLLIILFIAVSSLSAQNDSTIVKKTTLFNNKSVIHFKFKVNSRAEINTLTRIISIDNVDSNDVFAYANENEFNKFLAYNYSYELINDALIVPENQTTIQPANTSFQAINYYPSYTAYDSMMTAFSTNYPNICRIINIKTLNSGRKLLFAKISKNPDVKENEPTFLYTSSMHGDEITGYILMLDLINYLLTNYGIDPRITRMIDSTEIWINPLANPDGTYHGGNSSYIVTNAVRYNANNVDLNRNYPNRYAGPHPDGNAWQPETIAFMGLADTVNFTMSTNFHGGTQVCNYPWDDTLALTADDSWWQYVCREWVDTVHLYNATYMKSLNNGITDGAAWYTVTGGRQDYMNYYHHCREFTCEMSTNKTPVEGALPNYWTYNWHSFLNYIEQCQYGVRGNITDSITGNPIKAKVYISGFDKDSSEVYSFLPHGNYYRHLIAGNYNITYSAPCYLPKTISISAVNRSAVTQNVQLVPITLNAGTDVTRLCGDSLVFNPVTNYPNNPLNLTWAWSPAAGLNATTIKNPVAKPNTTTNYVVSLTSVEGCFASDTIQVTVNPMTVNLGIDVSNVCGDSVIFNPITNYPSNVSNLAYSWSPTFGLNNTTIKNPVAKPNTTTNYVINVTSVEGCFASDTIQITVNPMTVNAGNDVSNVCGDSVIFNPITNYPSNVSNLAYSWSPTFGLNNTTIKNPVAKPNTTTNYVINVTSIEGCFATDTIQVTINPMTVNLGIDVSNICGDSVIFNPITNYPSNVS
ncbi:MAG: M14 family zinc carboxypeptidase, partial [Bacteroidota bacterium]